MNSSVRRLLFSSDSDSDEELPPKRKKLFRENINFSFLADREFVERFRVRESEIETILQYIGAKISHRTTKNNALSPQKQILITLHFLGNGGQYHGMSDMHGVSSATICRAIHRVIDAIVEEMFKNIVLWPTNSINDATEFLNIGGFPSVCGLIDGTLIKINAPSENEEQFVDRKGSHSINAMMICGPHHQFYYVNPRWPGSVHDSRVLKNSNIYWKFQSGWRPFTNAVILGDSAYESSEWLMVPLNNDPNDDRERRYNRAHKSTRRIVECSYGILKSRFPCLKHLRVDPCFAGKIIMACATLHNVTNMEDFLNTDNSIDEEGETPGSVIPPTVTGQRRQALLEFFNY